MAETKNNECLLKNTHIKFNEAFILWEQAYENYFNPERFIANVNALIQALRNITFSLQAEKSSIPNFSIWYEKWQSHLKKDEVMKWICDARTQIVHKTDFEVNSYAVIRLYDYSTIYCADYKIPIDMPNDAIVGMLVTQGIVNSVMIRSEVIMEITRYWTVNTFRKYNILHILLSCFPIFSNLIVDAHKQAGVEIKECEFIQHEKEVKFPQKLISLLSDIDAPLVRKYSLKNLQPVDIEVSKMQQSEEEINLAKERYIIKNENFQELSFINKIIESAKTILRKDGFHVPLAFVVCSNGECIQLYFEINTRSDKYIAIEKLAKIIKEQDTEEVITIFEAFMIPSQYMESFLHSMDIDSVPEKSDVLVIDHIYKCGKHITYQIPFSKDEKGIVAIGEMHQMDIKEDNMMLPIIRAMKDKL